MKLERMRELLSADMLTRGALTDTDFSLAYCADLMSDVLSQSVTDSILITGLTNVQVIHTAVVADIRAIIFIQSKRPDVVTIALAEQKKIPLLATHRSMFDTCGLLYAEGLRSNAEA